MQHNRSNSARPLGALTGLLAFFLLATAAYPSNFRIYPTSLTLEKNAKSGVFSVINSGSEKLNVQVSLKEWDQDESGKDVYLDTRDVVFFPKIMTVEPNEQRAIRIGLKGPHSLREKTFRLYVQEIASQKKAPAVGGNGKIAAGLTIAFRYAVPIFVRPVQEKEEAVLEKVQMAKGTATATVKNTGNVHVKVLTVRFSGKNTEGNELFSQEIGGWYVLQGRSRVYTTAVPKDVCGKLATLDVYAQAENSALKGTLDVDKKMCSQ